MNEQPEFKKCHNCSKLLPIVDFHKKNTEKLTYSSRCKSCVSERQKVYYREENKQIRLARQAKPEYQLYIRKYRLKNKYGISLEEYDALLKEQQYRCAICLCNVPSKKYHKYLAVDHDHKTGKVRGLLCSNCNRALGFLKEQITTIQNMITYIVKYNDK